MIQLKSDLSFSLQYAAKCFLAGSDFFRNTFCFNFELALRLKFIPQREIQKKIKGIMWQAAEFVFHCLAVPC